MAEDAKFRAKKRFIDFLQTKNLRLTSQRQRDRGFSFQHGRTFYGRTTSEMVAQT